MLRASFLHIIFFLISNSFFSQGYNNRWSIELNPGVSNAVKPYSTGYWSNTIGLYHISMGTRFMFNNKFGLKWDIGYDRISHDKIGIFTNTGNSAPFKSNYTRTSLQFVLDIGRLMQFENFSEKVSLLFHTGGGMSWLSSKVNPDTDNMVNFMFGFAPQYKINERFSITTDVSFVWHIYQQYTWDMYNSVFKRGFDGFYANGTIGLNYYLGKNKTHMDWAFTPCFPDMSYLEVENRNLDSLNKKLQSNLRDDDGDGVANFMDDEKETPIGNIVNKRGVSLKNIDTDGDGVSDYIDKCVDIPGAKENEGCPQDLLIALKNNEKDRIISENQNGNNNVGQNGNNNSGQNNQVLTSKDGLTSLTDINFNLNESKIKPNFYAVLNEVVALLKANPNSKIVLEGHTDSSGEDDFNKLLSEKRTQSIRAYLLANGVDPNRVLFGSFGESKPKFLNTTTNGRSLNRRVEVYFKE